MSPAAGPVTVSVPATSANLGPGFDSLGLALDLRDRLTADLVEGPARITVEGEGASEVPLDEQHLVRRAMAAAFAALGVPTPALAVHCANAVPHARGLGSSSAAIVGGIVLARALVDGGAERLDDTAVLDLACALEGHPDNVAPALLGGFVISSTTPDGVVAARLEVDPRIGAVVLVPPYRLDTRTARGLLPAVVPHADAAANAARAALLVAALTGRPDLLLAATEDRLHQEHRRPAMPATLELVDALRADGVAAVVSGAGPTVLALVERGAPPALVVPDGWSLLTPEPGAAGARVERHGATVLT